MIAKDKIDISVVVPVYNEADVILSLQNELVSSLEGVGSYELIFVDDGSSDNSLGLLRDQQKLIPEISVIELSRNYGQTAALAAGIDHASGEVIITMDGDLQHSPSEIPRFLEKLEEGYDIVSGWREVRTDNFVLRRFPSWCANALMRWFSGMPVKDFGSTYKAYRAEILQNLELFGELHRFIPVLAKRLGARIVEIPIEVHPRSAGKSSYGLMRTFGVFEDIIFLEFFSNYLTKPIRAFGKLFMVFFGSGFAISFALMFAWVIGLIDAVRSHSALLLFSVFLMIIGVQFLVLGILAELLTRIYMHTSNSKIYSIRNVYTSRVEEECAA